MPQNYTEAVTETNTLVIRLSGANADTGALPLDQYWLSLHGWNDFFKLAGRIYARAATTQDKEPLSASLEIRIVAERKGSYEIELQFVLIAIAAGVIGNRADAAVVWTFRALLKWYRKLFNTYKKAKHDTTDVQTIVDILEKLTKEENLSLTSTDETLVDQEGDAANFIDELDVVTNAFSAERLLVEKLDIAIQNSTTLLHHECELIELIQDGRVLFSVNRNDYEDLHEQLTLPIPEGIWREAKVRFERINIKTGRALVYIEWQGFFSSSTAHARILDQDLGKPRNAYTEALSKGEPIKIWARQVRAERGRLNLMWEITVKPPDQLSLFGEAGTRA